MKLIDKSALVAEIEKRIKEIDEIGTYLSPKGVLTNLLCHLDTLEVKEVKESTASDRGMAEEIIFQLKRVEQDYFIDLTREMEWLRNIVKKGE